MNIYLLIDRSISMQPLMMEAVESINSYIRKLPRDSKVFIASFDYDNFNKKVMYETIRDSVVTECHEIAFDEVAPRGWTPLYDAVAMTIERGFKDNAEKSILVVMTDGADTASKEYTQLNSKELIGKWEKRGYEVVFLGANFADVETQSAGLGVLSGKTLNFAQGNFTKGMDVLAASTMEYSRGGSINYDSRIKADLSTPTK